MSPVVTKARLLLAATGLALTLCGCTPDPHTSPLTAPYDARTALGELSAAWTHRGEERAFAAAVRLKEPEVRFGYHVDVRNRSGDKLCLRLARFELVGADGVALAADEARVECTLAAGATAGVLAGDVWVPKHLADSVQGFRISQLAVPLSESGRDRYRTWRLQGQQGAASEVDAEVARCAAAPPCAAP